MWELLKYKIQKILKFFHQLDWILFNIIKNSKFIIGNSNGIMEAPYYGVSTINIGDRQKMGLDLN